MQIIVRQLIFTIANKFSKPLTLLGTLLNFWSKASDMLWAGSVEMISTVSRTRANCTERLQLLLKIRILKNLFQMFRSKKKIITCRLSCLHLLYHRQKSIWVILGQWYFSKNLPIVLLKKIPCFNGNNTIFFWIIF